MSIRKLVDEYRSLQVDHAVGKLDRYTKKPVNVKARMNETRRLITEKMNPNDPEYSQSELADLEIQYGQIS